MENSGLARRDSTGLEKRQGTWERGRCHFKCQLHRGRAEGDTLGQRTQWVSLQEGTRGCMQSLWKLESVIPMQGLYYDSLEALDFSFKENTFLTMQHNVLRKISSSLE